MAFAFKKFRNLEQQPPEEAPDKSADTKPAKKSKLSMYSHILSSFENSETAEDKRKKTIERIKQREREKKAREQEKLELEKQKREEELELQRQKKEEEDKKRREEEEERIREEIARKKEAEEKERRRKEWERTEGKYAGLKPAAAMFQRALDAKGSKNDTAAEKRVAALKKGTISEIRSKIFEQKADTRKTENKTKPGPKKLIITPANKEETIQSIIPEDKPVKTVSKEETVVTHSETEYNDKQLEGKEKTNISQDEENNCDKKVEENANKRQSFISDFAALEKTYKILGLSKISQDINEEETGKVPVKKRHNSEGKIKNKDKAKANKKPEIESDKPKEAKVDLVLKVQNQASRNYFQEKINETKGLNKDGQQLLGPRLRKKGSVANVFEQNSTDKAKRESQTIEEIRVDSEKFNSFLNKFESKDGREEARLKMIKITKEQKEFDRQRKAREKKYLEEQEELKKKAEEDQDKILQAALEEEILKQQKIEEELNMERIRNIEEEFIKLEKEEDEAAAKKKVVKKKKKNKKVNEDPVEAPPKINLLAGDVTNVRSVFEKNKKQVDHIKEPLKPVRINKLTVNPFEHLNTSEPTVEKEIKVSKLQKNSFIEKLEKKGNVPIEPAAKPGTKMIPSKKSSGETCIKFESKKERKPIEEHDTKCERKQEVRVSKSIEAPHPVNKDIKQKKSGSSRSLHKIFIEGPKEFFKSSKEKLYKISKETLCEVNEKNEKCEEHKIEAKKPSRSEMQNYLLSHVLFDGKEVTKKDKIPPKKDIVEVEDIEEIENYLDDEYRVKIEQYCALLEDDKPKRKKKKNRSKKAEETLPQLKTVEIKAIQEQLMAGLKAGKENEKKAAKGHDEVFVKHAIKVNKFKDMFDNDVKGEVESKTTPSQNNRKSQTGKSDIFSKIKALEDAEKERLERERQNEERIQYLLQKEMERQKDNEIHHKELKKESEDEAEEELKQSILQCLEDEVDNLEQEMIALDTQEQLILDEEREDLNAEEADESNDDAEEHKIHLQEIHEEIVERKKHAADKKREVLKRFQHVLDADANEDITSTGNKVGKLHDRLTIFNTNTETEDKKGFEDSVFVGVSDVMSKVKDKFENQQEKTLSLMSKEDIKRKVNPSALKFEQLTNNEDSVPSPLVKNTDWSWKKKTASELEADINGSVKSETIPEKKKSRNFQDTKFTELLADISAVKQRLHERDLEKENERKIQEMEELIDGVKESLKQHEEEYFTDDDDFEPEEFVPISAHSQNKTESHYTAKVNKIGDLKNRFINKESIVDKVLASKEHTGPEVSVSQIRKKISSQIEEPNKCSSGPELTSAKRSVSANITSKLIEIQGPNENDNETALVKAPKMILKTSVVEDTDSVPAKTLEDLKAEKEHRKWTWKEKDLSDLHNFINDNDDIAPVAIMHQQKNLKDIQDELEVVESMQGHKDAEILIQIREEKEREFNEFMKGVNKYIREDTKTVKEEEFKEGMKSYLALIESPKTKHAGDDEKKPLTNLNSIKKLKSSLLEGQTEAQKGNNKKNNQIKKLETKKIEALLQQSEQTKQSLPKENIFPSDQTHLVKKMFEEKEKETSPNITPVPDKSKAVRSSFAEKFALRAKEQKMKLMEHQFQYKQKTINDLHSYIESNELLATEALMTALRESKIRCEDQKLVYHEKFIDSLNSFLKESHTSEEQNIFMGNIRAYLVILDNIGTTYNATPKLRKHKGTNSQSNMRRAIIEKSVERPKQVETEKVDNISCKELSEEEKKRAILSKYGLKDRSKVEVEDISDYEDVDTTDEADIKSLTDRELCEKYGLPYMPDSSELYSRDRADSTSSFTGLLSKIRQATTEKSQAINATRKVFEQEKEESKEMIKSPTVKLRKRFDSECEETSRGSSPLPSYEPGSRMTDMIKRRFEEHRRSLVDEEVETINTFAQRTPLIKSGSTTKMKKLFESDSPGGSRTSSPLLRVDPGTIVTSRIKKRFEDSAPSSNRQSFIDDDSSQDSRSCSPMLRNDPGSVMTAKLRSRFEGEQRNEQTSDTKPSFVREIQKSSTVADIGSVLDRTLSQNKGKLNQKSNFPEKSVPMSPSLSRVGNLEKSKSFTKFKNAFESGQGLNDDSSDNENIDLKAGVNAELEALRTSAQAKSTMGRTKGSLNNLDVKKQNLAAAFFNKDKPLSPALGRKSPIRIEGIVKSSTVSDIGEHFKSSLRESLIKNVDKTGSQDSPEAKASVYPQFGVKHSKSFTKVKNAFEDGRGLLDEMDKPFNNKDTIQNKDISGVEVFKGLKGPVKSTTVSDIGEYLKSSVKDSQTISAVESIKNDDKPSKTAASPKLGLKHSNSFSKFKNAFEDGKGLMDGMDKTLSKGDTTQKKVAAEIEALKSSSKLQNMFRINKSKSSSFSESPRIQRRQSSTDIDLDEDTMTDVSRSRSAITNMFESKGPKMTFGGSLKPEKPVETKPAPKKKESSDMNERKWVFDTIQKYFDVIVEEEKEEENDEEDEESDEDDGVDGDEEDDNESDSDYTDAEDEIPEIDLPPPRDRSGTLPSLVPIPKPKELPRLALPSLHRTSSLRMSPHTVRASTASPATLPARRIPERKVSAMSISDIIDDAARQFDQMTDGSELSLDASPVPGRHRVTQSASSHNIPLLQKSNSSSKIRSLLQSVVHGSNTSLNVSTFKTNLCAHLSTSRGGSVAGSRSTSRCASVVPGQANMEPGVGEDSSSDYSEYD